MLYLLHVQHEDDIDGLKEEIEKLKRQITDAVSNTSKHINSTLRYVTIRYLPYDTIPIRYDTILYHVYTKYRIAFNIHT